MLPVQGSDWLLQLNKSRGGEAGFIGGLMVARFEFDAAVIANRPVGPHGTGVFLPANALVVGGFVNVNTGFTSASTNTGTIAINTEAAGDIIAAAAVVGAPYSTTGRKAITPKVNTPESTSILVTTQKEIICTVAVAALLTGKLTGYLFFVAGG